MSLRAAIQIENDRRAFAPGETLRGRVGWQTNSRPERVELRLFYYTKGRGTRDVDVAETKTWDAPGPDGLEEFEFALPNEPYSFSGKLVSLVWGLELVLHPNDHTERLEITLSPSGGEVDLYRYPVPEELGEASSMKKLKRNFNKADG